MLEITSGNVLQLLDTPNTYRPRYRQLDLFGGFGTLVIPSDTPTEEIWQHGNSDNGYVSKYVTVVGFQCGPAETECSECGDTAYPVRNPSGSWVNPCCLYYCNGCSYYEESNCSSCESCNDCCECACCSECSEIVSRDDHCSNCERCLSCCFCSECSECGDRFADANYCPNSEHCDYCHRRGYCDCVCECSDCQQEREEDSCYAERSASFSGMIGSDGFRIGIELEFKGSRNALFGAFFNQYDGMFGYRRTDDYSETSTSQWLIKPDGSVSNGGELVSPPMDWSDPETRNEIRNVLEILRSVDAYVDDQTGLHVHVEAMTEHGEEMTWDQIRNMMLLCAKNEDALYRIASHETGKIRSGSSSYCVPFSLDEISRIEDACSVGSLYSATRGNRYKGFNVQSHAKHGTVEFRYFNATTDADKVIALIAMCVGFKRAACNLETDPMLGTFHTQGCNYMGNSESDDILRELQSVLRNENAIDNEDWNTLIATCWKGSAFQAPIGGRF